MLCTEWYSPRIGRRGDKGLRYRTVIFLWADLLPFAQGRDVEQDRRLFYVGGQLNFWQLFTPLLVVCSSDLHGIRGKTRPLATGAIQKQRCIVPFPPLPKSPPCM